jgi:glutamyl-tRNA(Gln) amidotransferase subunit E
LIQRLVYYEGVRQCALLALRGELESRGIGGDSFTAASTICTGLFEKTASAAIAQAVGDGGVVGAVKLSGFAGLLRFPLCPGRTFADEIKGRVRVIACLDRPPILFHTDQPPRERHGLAERLAEPRETGAPASPGPPAAADGVSTDGLATDGLSTDEVLRLRRALEAGPADAIVAVWGGRDDVATALQEVEARAREATVGVPNETRQALAGGVTDFERILPGPNRMYPDTDSAPIPIEPEHLEGIRSRLPPSPASWRQRYGGVLPQELISRLIDGGTMGVFHELYPQTGCRPTLLAHTLASTLKHLARRKVQVGDLPPPRLAELFRACSRGRLPAEALPAALAGLTRGASVRELCAEFTPLREEEIRAAASEALAALGPAAWRACGEPDLARARLKVRNFLIGRVRRKLGPRAAGRTVCGVVEELLAAQAG